MRKRVSYDSFLKHEVESSAMAAAAAVMHDMYLYAFIFSLFIHLFFACQCGEHFPRGKPQRGVAVVAGDLGQRAQGILAPVEIVIRHGKTFGRDRLVAEEYYVYVDRPRGVSLARGELLLPLDIPVAPHEAPL